MESMFEKQRVAYSSANLLQFHGGLLLSTSSSQVSTDLLLDLMPQLELRVLFLVASTINSRIEIATQPLQTNKQII